MSEGKDILMMSREEVQRYQIVRKVLDKIINQQEAAEYLRRSDRQVRRIVRRVRAEGESGVIHKLRGNAGCHRIKAKIRERILELYRRQYEGFGPLLASEKMRERDGVKVNDETLRLWLIQEGHWQITRHRKPKERSWRARKEHLGEMVQMDGSQHDWLEGRGERLVLMGYIDDATGRFYGKFYEFEGTMSALGSLKEYIKRYGIPKSIYLDKHSTYKYNRPQRYKDWPFRDKEELTQFGRACKQLGIELIYANSPQAKGRVERVFGTHQDRLVKELRLAGAKTCAMANQVLKDYLPRFNQKFEVPAKEGGDLHRPVDERIDLDEILSIQSERVLRNDRTVMHQNRWYQILTKTRAERVQVCEYLNGRMAIKHGSHRLDYKPIEGPQQKVVPRRKVKQMFRQLRPAPVRGSNYWRDSFKLEGSLPN
jgi:Homeodomain-like domain